VFSPLLIHYNPNQKVISFAFLFFSYGVTWIVNNLLAKRTGHVLNFILQSIFFGAILFFTLTSLITIRLIIVDEVM